MEQIVSAKNKILIECTKYAYLNLNCVKRNISTLDTKHIDSEFLHKEFDRILYNKTYSLPENKVKEMINGIVNGIINHNNQNGQNGQNGQNKIFEIINISDKTSKKYILNEIISEFRYIVRHLPCDKSHLFHLRLIDKICKSLDIHINNLVNALRASICDRRNLDILHMLNFDDLYINYREIVSAVKVLKVFQHNHQRNARIINILHSLDENNSNNEVDDLTVFGEELKIATKIAKTYIHMGISLSECDFVLGDATYIDEELKKMFTRLLIKHEITIPQISGGCSCITGTTIYELLYRRVYEKEYTVYTVYI